MCEKGVWGDTPARISQYERFWNLCWQQHVRGFSFSYSSCPRTPARIRTPVNRRQPRAFPRPRGAGRLIKTFWGPVWNSLLSGVASELFVYHNLHLLARRFPKVRAYASTHSGSSGSCAAHRFASARYRGRMG